MNKLVTCGMTTLLVLAGCVSAERIADYEAWKVSEDGAPNVEFADFESQYKEGWQARAAEKKAARLAREEAERKERERLEAERLAKEVADCKAKLAEHRRQEMTYHAAVWKRNKEIADFRRARAQANREKLVADKALKIVSDEVEAYWAKEADAIKANLRNADYSDICAAIKIGRVDGKAIIETFAESHMPKLNDAYEQAKERAMELEQVLESEFEGGVPKGSLKYEIYCRCLDRFAESCAAFNRKYKEIAHYHVLYKAGVLTDADLENVDSEGVRIKFESSRIPNHSFPKFEPLGAKEAEFAAKFMPETYRFYQVFAKDHEDTRLAYSELIADTRLIGVDNEPVFMFVREKGCDLVKNLNALFGEYEGLYLQHRLGEKTAAELEEIDTKRANDLTAFADELPTRVADAAKAKETESFRNARDLVDRQVASVESLMNEVVVNEADFKLDAPPPPPLTFSERELRSIIPIIGLELEFVSIPNRNFKMQKTEVTQRLWKAVMGNNPSSFRGDDLPVENVSWNDCQEFIERLNQCGMNRYRLPTEEEWEYCCRAGSKGDWGKRANGQEGPLEVMGWYWDNIGYKTHPVAQKEPNAWGLYDMHGNVREWTSTARGSNRVNRGGSWSGDGYKCMAGNRSWNDPDDRYFNLGFRLISEDL